MDFSTLKTRVANELGLDVNSDDSLIGAWVNATINQINAVANWPWLLKQATIQTVPDITTGTVSITAGTTALTFSSAPSSSVANQYMIQISSISDDWYIISSHTAGSTSATLSVPLVGSTNVSGGSYVLRKVLYSLPSDLDRMVDIRQSITNQKLVCIDPRTFDLYLPNPTAVASPQYYAVCGLDTNKYWQLTLYPIPDEQLNLQMRYSQVTPTLSATTDTPLIPVKFHDIIIYGALYLFGYDFIDDTRVTTAADRYKAGIELMKDMYSPVPDQLTVLQPWDTRPGRRIAGPLPPSNYPYFNW